MRYQVTSKGTEPPASAPVERTFTRRVLVIDDDETCRECLAECLRLEGFLVATARDAGSALERLSNGSLPHVILLEATMPRVGGVEVHRRLMADATWRRIPVLMMAPSGSIVSHRDFDGARLLEKPIDVDALVDELRSMALESIRPPSMTA